MSERTRSLDQSMVQGFAWTGIARWLTQVVSWSSTLVTARLLTPDDYGIFGMAMVYVGLAQIVTEAGVATSIIQRPRLADEEAAEFGGTAILLGLAFTALSVALAAPIAHLLGDARLIPVLMVLSSVFALRCVQVVPRALMSREMAFRRLAAIDTAESMALLVSTLLFAIAGWGHWALVLGSVVSHVLSTVLSLRWRPHRIAMPTQRLKEGLAFMRQVITSQLAFYGYTNADTAITGRVLGVAASGAYSFAWSIANIPGERVTSLVGRVMPPLFAAVQRDKAALRRYFRAVTMAVAVVTLPLSVGMTVVADEFVPTVLGAQWIPATAPLAILAILAAFRAILVVCGQVVVASGGAGPSVRFNLIAVTVMPPAFLIGSQWGTSGVALAWLVVYPAVAIATFARSALRAAQMPWREYVSALWPATRATVLMAAAVIGARELTPAVWSPIKAFMMHVAVGAVAYSVLLASSLSSELRVVLHLTKRSFAKRRTGGQPVFTSGAPTGQHRLLLISYHFPPAESVGALRWQKLTRLAAERGWECDVITAHPDELGSRDWSRLAELPPGTRIFGVKRRPLLVQRVETWLSKLLRRAGRRGSASRPAIHRNELRWRPRSWRDVVRAWTALVEAAADRRWASAAADASMQAYQPGVHRAVISCGPPHSAHSAGREVSQLTDLPHIMDLRDPWSLVQRMPEHGASRVALAIASREEARAVAGAALIVANTKPLATTMGDVYPEARDRIIAVTNGADEDPVPASHRNGRFVIAYAGTIYLDRDPRVLFRAVARLCKTPGVDASRVSVEFMGDVEHFEGTSLVALAEREGIRRNLRLRPTAQRREALDFLASASVLVVLPQDSDLAVPAKVFDYARFNAGVVAIAEPDSAIGQLLEGTGAEVVSPSNGLRLATILELRYHEYLAGIEHEPLANTPRLTRRYQAGVLFDAIESIAGAPVPAPLPVDPTPEPQLQCAAS
jgi:teichuronic acid exporter